MAEECLTFTDEKNAVGRVERDSGLCFRRRGRCGLARLALEGFPVSNPWIWFFEDSVRFGLFGFAHPEATMSPGSSHCTTVSVVRELRAVRCGQPPLALKVLALSVFDNDSFVSSQQSL